MKKIISILLIIGLLVFVGCSSNEIKQDNVTKSDLENNSENIVEGNNAQETDFLMSYKFIENLESCTHYIEYFKHPFNGEKMKREIVGLENGFCHYIEEMPNAGKMECKYSKEIRDAIVPYYKEFINTESTGINLNVDFNNKETNIEYTINGKVVTNPIAEAFDNGECVITGY